MGRHITEDFGTTEDGDTVQLIRLVGGGLTANVMTWGAALQDLRLDGYERPLVLGFPNFASYPLFSPYFGQTPGRFANRIAGGQFSIDGKNYQLECNENGKNHLHGGSRGIGKRQWVIDDRGKDFVRLSIVDPDGQSGYPGNCRVQCEYRLKEGGVLSIVYLTEADQPTLANITHHSYFNLDGSPTILEHELMILADRYLPVDSGQIPTGTVQTVASTGFDFRNPRSIAAALNEQHVRLQANGTDLTSG